MTPVVRAVVLAFIGLALSLAASADRWKGLPLGEATPDQARAALGSPKKESVERLYRNVIGPVLTDEIKIKTFLRWRYDSIEGFSRADLFFKDGRLVALVLAPDSSNKMLARDVSSIYDGAPFEVLLQAGDQYEWDSVHKRARRNYPGVYTMVAATERTFLSVVVAKGFAAGMESMLTGADEHLPGKVVQIHYVSRTLERPRATNETLR